jgi:hypothetical protein
MRAVSIDRQTVGLVICGANIDPETFTRQIAPQ